MGSFNARSFVPKSSAFALFASKLNLSLVAVQEPLLPPNIHISLPGWTILHKTVTLPNSPPRDLLWLVNSRIHHAITLLPVDPFNLCTSSWISVNSSPSSCYLCNFYCPIKKQEADLALHTLLTEVNSFPVSTPTILFGDFNGDPYNTSHYAHSRITQFISNSGLHLIPRPHSSSYTRRVSNSHIDLVLANRAALPLIASSISYHYSHRFACPPHNESDHVPISLTVCSSWASLPLSKHTMWNLKALASNPRFFYFNTHILSIHWLNWRANMIDKLNYPLPQDAIDALWQGLLFVLRQSALQGVGTTQSTSSISVRYKLPPPSFFNSPSVIWKFLKNRRSSQHPFQTPSFSPEDWHTYATDIFNSPPPASDPYTSSLIDHSMLALDNIISNPVHPLPPDLFGFYCKSLKKGKIGPDNIPSDFLKYSHSSFHHALAAFSFDARSACYFPPAVMSSSLLYIHKGKGKPTNVQNNFRPIKSSSSIGKVIEKSTISPINPPSGDIPYWFNPGQFAARKSHSAEALCFILYLHICLTAPAPLFILFTDIEKAFDRTWKMLFITNSSKRVPHLVLLPLFALFTVHYVQKSKIVTPSPLTVNMASHKAAQTVRSSSPRTSMTFLMLSFLLTLLSLCSIAPCLACPFLMISPLLSIISILYPLTFEPSNPMHSNGKFPIVWMILVSSLFSP